MTRDYKHISRKPVKKPLLTFNAVSFGIGLGIGLAVALSIYLAKDLPSLSAFLIEQSRNKEVIEDEIPVARESLPEPTFDFYRILPNMEVNVSEYETEEKPPPPESIAAEESPATYILQVGSFKEFEAADEVKARLALLGVSADIQRVVINGQDVYHRVRVGPYNNTDNLEDIQQRLLANNLDFKILKLTVDDL